MSYRILAINPGSTSTKIAVYDNEKQILVKSIDHKVEDLEKYDKVQEQFEMRKEKVLKALKENNIHVPEDMEIIVSGDDEALEYTTPTVTSLRMPMLDMAKSALEMMLTMIENNISIPMNRILVPDFIIRQSCGDFPELEDSVKKR